MSASQKIETIKTPVSQSGTSSEVPSAPLSNGLVVTADKEGVWIELQSGLGNVRVNAYEVMRLIAHNEGPVGKRRALGWIAEQMARSLNEPTYEEENGPSH